MHDYMRTWDGKAWFDLRDGSSPPGRTNEINGPSLLLGLFLLA
jgi:hypothetical protein